MAQYNIQFSSNASAISKQLSQLQADIARLGITRTDIKLKLDTADFTRAIDSSFKELDKAISKVERRLRKLSIGSPEFTMAAEQSGQLRGERERGRMMASAIGSREAAQAFDTGSLARYERALESLRIQASLIAPNTREWVNLQRNIGTIRGEMQKASKTAESIQLRETLNAFSPGSLNQLQARLTILKTRAYDITPNTTAWKQLNKEIQRTEGSIKKLSRPPLTMGQRAGAAGGAFLYGGGLGGGAGSALGGIAGGLAGGVPGAFTGAALGQLTDNMGQALGATASYTAEIDKQRIALKNVTKDVGEYKSALGFIDRTSRDLAIPQDILNKQFTQISASVIGAGGNVDAAKEAFLGIAAGIRGTGGSLADMQGALLATSQVFSKGKVSAEELRQQIGERLPGAFTLFAQSMGKTPQELDKMLEQGQVTLNDFMGFVRLLSSEYGASANEIAASSQAAGDRLATTMSRVREAVGRELQPLGAQFQEIFARFFEEAEPGMVAFAQGLSKAILGLGSAAQAFQEFTRPIRDFIATYPPMFSAFWSSIASDVSELANKIQTSINAIVSFWQTAWRGLQSSTRAVLESIGIDANWLAGEFQKIINWLQNAWSNAFSFIAGRWRQTVENMVNYSNPLAATLKGLGVDVGKAVADGFEAGMSGGGLPGAPSVSAPPVTPSTFAFPGSEGTGAGAGSGAGGAKAFNAYDASRLKFLQLEASLEKQSLQRKLDENLISKTQFDIELANLEARQAMAQVDENLRLQRLSIARENLSEQDKIAKLNDTEIEAEKEKAVARAKHFNDIVAIEKALSGPILEANKQNIAQIEEQAMLAARLLDGYQDLSIEQKADLQMRQRMADMDEDAIKLQKENLDRERQLTVERLKGEQAVNYARRIGALQNEIQLLLTANDVERERLRIRQEFSDLTPEQQLQIINLEEIKKKIQDVRAMIDDLVSSTVSDYKGFFKSVLFGEDPVEALKEFQKRLADKTLTLFLDFAMAPVEQFFKESLFNLFKPEESKEVAAATSNTSALDKNTAAIEANTAAQGGQAPTSAMTSVPGVGNTPTSSLFSMGGLGSQAVNAPMAIDIAAFGGASSAIDSLNESVYSMGDAIPSFQDSLGNITDTVYKASEETNAQGATFSENLGKAVGAIGIAATSVMGIAAGIGQIKEGGASNVLGGIGSVLMGIGGGIGGFGKLFGANGGVAAGGWKPFPVSAFANGGVVNGPTLGLVGEGKFNEAIVPLPDGRSIPVKMAGSSSRDLINNQSSSQSSSPVLSMSFETTTINGVEYVDRAQLESAMQETRKLAAREGASRGASLALDKLQNSPSTRRRVGMR
jgi:tape measure domain-containing protein